MMLPSPVLAFFNNLAGPDLLVIGVVALLIFGKRLPEVGRSLGRGLMEFKRGLREAELEIRDGLNEPPPTPTPKASLPAPTETPRPDQT